MDFLNFLAGIAEIILAMELVVVVFVIAALCGGVWFGLRFAEKKTVPALDKANAYIARGRAYERTGLRLAVRPIVAVHAAGEQVGVTISALVEKARANRTSA